MNQKGVIALLVILILAGGAWMLWGKKSQRTSDTIVPGQAASTVSDATTSADTYGSLKQDPNLILSESIQGTWISTDDPKFTRTFKADGTVTDAYKGDASATDTGTYAVVDPAKEADFPMPAANFASMKVIKISFKKSGVMYFGVVTMTHASLQLSNISGRGNTLSFTRGK